MEFEANCLTTGIGSVPCTDAAAACDMVFEYFDVPYWPQLPRKSSKESMPQFFEGFPGFVAEGDKLYIDPEIFESQLGSFYQRIVDFETHGISEDFAIGERYARGLHWFLKFKERMKGVKAVKGQIIGPISFGLNVTAANGKPMIYDDTMRDTLIRNLQMKVRYQEELLRTVSPNVMIFIDESSLDLIYSPHIGYDEVKAKQDLQAILGVIRGLRGVHCCTNTNWPFLLDLVDVISFDAYNYSHRFVLHPGAIRDFTQKGGIIAWGIVPTSEDVFKEDADSLMNRLEYSFEYLAANGIEYEDLLRQSLITPACGLGTRSMQTTVRAFELTREVSGRLRQKYSLQVP
ncbi:MAG: hypothetical protein Q8P44_03295 [Dehalococcoidia bacterium]|nr:hypothetical protein [Dehalococcoidia bacterium]